MATRYIIQEDGVAHILLEDSSGALIKDGVGSSTDDVLIRIGPKASDTDHSGLVAPAFTATSGAAAVSGGMYYKMMQQWFEAA